MTALPTRLRRWLAALALTFALPAAAADIELPPVDEVFVLSALATARDRIEVRWQIADGYYLYRHRTSVKADAAFTGGTLALPKGKAYRDEFFGDVETYRQQLVGTLTGVPAPGATTTTLTVKYQGCADAGVCYPPQTRTLKVVLPGEAGDDGSGFGFVSRKGGLFGVGGGFLGSLRRGGVGQGGDNGHGKQTGAGKGCGRDFNGKAQGCRSLRQPAMRYRRAAAH